MSLTCAHSPQSSRSATVEPLADGYCILHCPDPAKDREQFTKAINEKIEASDFDFQNIVFPHHFRFPQKAYSNADFSHATFHGIISLGGCVFTGGACFSNALFHRSLTLSGVEFNGRASFMSTHFEAEVDARGAGFNGPVEFGSARFEGVCRFDRVKFNGTANFSQAVFRAPAAFDSAQFRRRADFTYTSWDSGSSFSEVEFQEHANFSAMQQTDPYVMHDWQGATFRSTVSFDDDAMVNKLSLERSTFHGPAHFFRTTIRTLLNLNECTFHDDVIFGTARLEGTVYGAASTFHAGLAFVGTVSVPGRRGRQRMRLTKSTFGGTFTCHESQLYDLDLDDCTFQDVSLSTSVFHGNVYLPRAKITGRLMTSRTTFLGQVDLTEIGLPAAHTLQGIDFKGSADFSGVDLKGITFRQMSLANCRFANSINLADAEFDSVTWASWPSTYSGLTFALTELVRLAMTTRWDWWSERERHVLAWSRIAVADELEARQSGLDPDERQRRLRAAERVYRGLRASHEDHKDHPRARSFYFGEMEMRRLNGSLNPLNPRFEMLTPLYALISGYGERVRLAAGWFVVLWLVCALVYLGTGLWVKEAVPGAQGVLQVRLVEAGGPAWVADCLRLACSPGPIGNALLHSMYVATFIGRDTHAIVRPGLGEAVQLMELVLGPLFAALAALAIRRRFHR